MSWHSQTLDENFFSPPLFSSRRDVPPERLYKFVRVAEKGVQNPDLVLGIMRDYAHS
jgi:predicted transcriptional regulator